MRQIGCMANMHKHEELSLEEARRFIAQLIADGQTAYLPIFERLEKELEAKAGRDRLLARALSVANQK